MDREEMIEVLVDDMDSWDTEVLLDWAMCERRLDLEGLQDEDIEIQYEQFVRKKQ